MMSAADDDAAGLALGASRVGAELRATRLQLGWSLSDVSGALRIRLPYLEAIEEGRVSDLPGAAYAVGFLRSYATILGLDADEVARRFRAEAHEVNRKPELSFPAPVPERGVPAGAVVLLGVLLAAGAYVAWYRLSADHRADPGVSPIPERLAPLADRTTPSSTLSPQVASVLPPPAPLAATPPAPAVTTAPALQAAAAPLPPTIPTPTPVPVALTPQAAAPATAPKPDNRVMLRFKSDAYIQVREKQGQVLLNKIMRAGDSWPVPNEPNLLMTTGNAGGTEIDLDGTPAAPLGPAGAVRRDIPLEPEAIKMGPGGKPLPGARTPQ